MENKEIDLERMKKLLDGFGTDEIARTYLYFKKTYDLYISKKQLKLYKA